MFRNIIIGVLLGASTLLFILWNTQGKRLDILNGNQMVLLDTIEHYKVRDSLSAVGLGVLRLEVNELRLARAKDVELIEDMGIRLRRAQSISKVFTASKYEVISVDYGDSWRYNTDYINFSASINSDTLKASVVVYDTIVQVLHRVPRFKFLGIWFGTRGVRQEIVSKNPHTRIAAAEYIEIVR